MIIIVACRYLICRSWIKVINCANCSRGQQVIVEIKCANNEIPQLLVLRG